MERKCLKEEIRFMYNLLKIYKSTENNEFCLGKLTEARLNGTSYFKSN